MRPGRPAGDLIMTQRPVTEDQARDLFVRQLEALSRMGAAPESQARLAAIFAKSEDACREQENEFADGEDARRVSTPRTR